MPDTPGPVASRRQLGAALRHYREAARKTVAQAAGSSMADVVHLEGLGFSEAIYLDRAEQVGEFLRAFDGLRDAALTAGDSIAFLKAVHSTYRKS